jgi:hypothetical protein
MNKILKSVEEMLPEVFYCGASFILKNLDGSADS